MSLSPDDIKVGETRESVLVDDLKRTRIVQYAGASGDFNPCTPTSGSPSRPRAIPASSPTAC